MGTRVFWTEPTGDVDIVLRRYTVNVHDSRRKVCPVHGDYHHRWSGVIERIAEILDGDHHADLVHGYAASPWWPECCDCGYRFTMDDEWQVFQFDIYRAADGREGEWRLRNMPVGAMWELVWLGVESWKGPDGMALAVRVPVAHDWWPDMQASNCTRRCPWWDDAAVQKQPAHATQTLFYGGGGWVPKQDDKHTIAIAPHNAQCDPRFTDHKCWVRHGNPRAGDIHVDKNGATCAAGAGSILTPDWHGFLHHSVLA